MFKELIRGKKVLFISTKNIDYIRNTQEIHVLREHARRVDLLCSSQKRYSKRLLEVYSRLFAAWFQCIFKKGRLYDCDVVFVGFAPQLIIPIFRPAIQKKTTIIDFFISIYDTMVCDRKKIKDGSIASKACHWIDEITLRNIDCIISDTKAHAEFFIKEFGAKQEKVETLYLEADKTIYYPRSQDKPVELKDKFLVLYFGSILPLQGVDIVLDAIRMLKNNDEISFEIIGPIPKAYDKPIQDNVRYIDWLEQEELAKHIADADVCLAGHFNGSIEKANRTIPGKAYIYEAMGKKMILGNSCANRELFNDDDLHLFVDMSNAKELANKIRMMGNKWYKSELKGFVSAEF